MHPITPQIALGDDELQFSYVRASGPGGQNVNKVSTAVQLRFDAAASPSIPEDVRQRLLRLAGKRATDEGTIIIDARRFRTQEGNRLDAVERLTTLIAAAATPPRPRHKTKPTKASCRRRVEEKRQRSDTKKARGKVADGDD